MEEDGIFAKGYEMEPDDADGDGYIWFVSNAQGDYRETKRKIG